MGGHGGLNILPQKRWDVYNYENREKARKDEEAAAKDEQLKREQSRKRDTEFRQARGLASSSSQLPETELKSESKSNNHINLFEGIKIFDPIDGGIEATGDEKRGRDFKRLKKEAAKMKKEAESKVVGPEDGKYKLGYGLVGKGVKLPWYMSKKAKIEAANVESDGEVKGREETKSNGGKKTIKELREERLRRERRENERVKALLSGKGPRDGPNYKDRYYTGV